MALRCNICSQEFDSATALSQHLKDKHGMADTAKVSSTVNRANSASSKLLGMISKKKGITVGALLVISLALFVYLSTTNHVEAGMQGVDGVECNSLEGTAMHVHPHLSILYNGQNLTVPARIGLESSCLYWLHTHDFSGTIHIESPTIANYTFGEFVDVWAKTQPQGPSYTVASLFDSSSITAYVNNVLYTGSFRNIVLTDGEQIRLVIES